MDTTNETDLRQERGRLLSLDKRIHHVTGATWVVPSAQGEGAYIVNTQVSLRPSAGLLSRPQDWILAESRGHGKPSPAQS